MRELIEVKFSFALAVQQLAVNHRILVLSYIAGARHGDGWFSASDVIWLFQALRLPQPSALVRSLGRLKGSDLLTHGGGDRPWALTPFGQRQAIELIGGVDHERIEAELIGTPGAQYAEARHSIIPPAFAPTRWQHGIARLLERFPFETNVFCMTRFPRTGETNLPDPLPAVIEVLRDVVNQHGLCLHLASDRQIEDDLLGNVGAYMWACQYGIGLLGDRGPKATGLNSNVLIELGSMLVTGRRCAILKDKPSPSPPSDLSGQIYKSVDLDDPQQVSDATHLWLAEDLSLGRCIKCPPVTRSS